MILFEKFIFLKHSLRQNEFKKSFNLEFYLAYEDLSDLLEER